MEENTTLTAKPALVISLKSRNNFKGCNDVECVSNDTLFSNVN